MENSLELFNESMNLFYGMKNIDKNDPLTWFFSNNIVRNGNYYSLNNDIIKSAINNENYKNLFIVYGSEYSVPDNNRIYFEGKFQPRYLGFNMNGDSYDNPDYPFDSWSGWKISERIFFKNPWNNIELCNHYKISKNRFSGSEIKLSRPDGTEYIGNLEKNIQLGLDLILGTKTGKDLLVNPDNLADIRLYDAGTKPNDPINIYVFSKSDIISSV